jgi:hypothetical protein
MIAERTKDEVESQLSMFNHMVEYMGRGLIVNLFVECWDGVLRSLLSRFLFDRLQTGAVPSPSHMPELAAAAMIPSPDVAFRERLVKAIEDQNALLREIVDRVAPPT